MKNMIVVSVLLLTLTGCAGINTGTNIPNPEGDIAGFWWGLWHGMVSPFAFIGSLFSDNISVYEVHNNGSWYDLGFMLGIGFALRRSGSSDNGDSPPKRKHKLRRSRYSDTVDLLPKRKHKRGKLGEW